MSKPTSAVCLNLAWELPAVRARVAHRRPRVLLALQWVHAAQPLQQRARAWAAAAELSGDGAQQDEARRRA